MKTPLGLLLPLLAACAATNPSTTLKTELVPGAEQRELDLTNAEKRRTDFRAVLVRLDQAMESYAQTLNNRGAMRADQQTERWEKLLQETVLDRGPAVVTQGRPAPPPGDNFVRLKAAAIDGVDSHAQGIALAALGFSGDVTVMPLILQGAQLADPVLVDRAVFGLAILRAPATPPGVLFALIDDDKRSEWSRTQAAWALYRLQEVSEQKDAIVKNWLRLLAAPQALPGGVLVQAVRGTGLSRDATNVGVVAPLLRHPATMVRMAAADAVARMNGQQHAKDLIALLGPEEPMPNVRLHARKALQALAGDADYGYDVAAWRKVFDRGQK